MADKREEGSSKAWVAILVALIGFAGVVVSGSFGTFNLFVERFLNGNVAAKVTASQNKATELEVTPASSPQLQNSIPSSNIASIAPAPAPPPRSADACTLAGRWSLMEVMPGATQGIAYPARFEEEALVVDYQVGDGPPSMHLRFRCVLHGDLLALGLPTIEQNGVSMQMPIPLYPDQFLRQADGSYMGTRNGSRFYLQPM